MYFISKDPANGFSYGAISLLFNRTNFTTSGVSKETEKIIDDFFDSLELKDLSSVSSDDIKNNPNLYPDKVTAKEVKIGSLLNAVNMKRRWIYMGSTTMPPCQSYTYWNVLSTIYPIKEKHYKILKS